MTPIAARPGKTKLLAAGLLEPRLKEVSLALLPDDPDQLRPKAATRPEKLRRPALPTKSHTPGSDNKTVQPFDRDGCKGRIARADALLPLVAAHESALPSYKNESPNSCY